MKITPTGSTPPTIVQSNSNSVSPATRERAINMLVNEQPLEHSVNQNQISPEEMSAIAPKRQEIRDNQDNVETPEDTQEAKQEAAEQDPSLRRQFAQLARQEKALRARAQQQERAIKEREAALAAREAALAPKVEQPKASPIYTLDALKQDPLSALAEAGVTYDELTQHILAQQSEDPRQKAMISRLEAKIQKLEEASLGAQKSYEEQQQQTYKAALRQIETDAISLISKNPEQYEAIAKTKAVKEVVKLIEKTYEQDGIVLSIEDAAEAVENELVERTYGQASRIEKIKRRLAQSAQTAKAEEKQPATNQQSQMKTLTNAASSTRKLTVRERAIAAMEGRLK